MLVFTTSKFGCHQEIAKWLGSLLALKREWVASSPSFVDGHPHDLLHLGNVSSILSDSARFCGTLWNCPLLFLWDDQIQYNSAQLRGWNGGCGQADHYGSCWDLLQWYAPCLVSYASYASYANWKLGGCCRLGIRCAKRVFLFEETGNGSKHTKLEESVHHYLPINTH